jgi:hypothetical protein
MMEADTRSSCRSTTIAYESLYFRIIDEPINDLWARLATLNDEDAIPRAYGSQALLAFVIVLHPSRVWERGVFSRKYL